MKDSAQPAPDGIGGQLLGRQGSSLYIRLYRNTFGTAGVSRHRERFTPQKFRGTAKGSHRIVFALTASFPKREPFSTDLFKLASAACGLWLAAAWGPSGLV